MLGTGRKQLAPSERANYGRSNRSLHALGDIAAGEPLTSRNVAALRTEHNLNPGLSPRHLATVLGSTEIRIRLVGLDESLAEQLVVRVDGRPVAACKG